MIVSRSCTPADKKNENKEKINETTKKFVFFDDKMITSIRLYSYTPLYTITINKGLLNESNFDFVNERCLKYIGEWCICENASCCLLYPLNSLSNASFFLVPLKMTSSG